MSLEEKVKRAEDDINAELQEAGRICGFDIIKVHENGTVEVASFGDITIDEIQKKLQEKVPEVTSVVEASITKR